MGGFAGVHGKGLLAQHGLSGLQRSNGQVGMAVWGQGVVDEVDIVAREQGFVGVCDMRDALFVGIGLRALGVAGGHGHDFAVGACAGRLDDCFGCNFRCAENADPDHVTCLVFMRPSRGLWTGRKQMRARCLPRPNSA